MNNEFLFSKDLVKVEGNDATVMPEVVEFMKDFEKKKEIMAILDKRLKQDFKKIMEERGIKKLIINGLSIIHKDGYIRVTLDSKRLKEELPDIYEEYSKVTEVDSTVMITVGD